MTTYTAIILAAGRGERSGQENGPKQYRRIGGKSVLARAVDVFLSDENCTRIIVVRHIDDEALCKQALGSAFERIEVVIGAGTRQASTLNALNHLHQSPPDYVMIHDAARPFVDSHLLSRIVDALEPGIGVLPAVAVSDTLKRAQHGELVESTIARTNLFAAQTPQAFPFKAIHNAHLAASAERNDFTDDSAIAEWAGIPVKLVEGAPDNIKLTWKRDIEMADERLSGALNYPDVRTGNGYDVHSFVPGEHVTLGGVSIGYTHALNGHSDSDVALHALTDALLATCGAGDIGTHFPPTDQRWKDVASSIFVKHAASLIRAKSGRIANVDITLICEAPKIGPHREAMVGAISAMLDLDPDRVSIKATTNEKLGFIGRGEGIAAIATASIVFPGGLK
jgi:2-C-methyl-D-erythritol 4-phosphate cytidylyltransferase/2-C-methyl-D-erythritol 2,4-cyclodiphosphate synthase